MSPSHAFGPSARPPRILLAMGLMLLSALCYAVMSALIRHMGDSLHPLVIAFYRSLFGLRAVLPLLLRHGTAILKTRRPGLHVLRTLFATVSMFSFFTALTMTPLAKVTALHFTTPVIASFLTVLILKEAVRLRRVLALMAGFTGAMIILRPGAVAFDLGPVLVLITSFLWGMGLVTTKLLTRTDSSLTIALYLGLIGTPIALIPALFVWQVPTFPQLLVLMIIGALGTLSHVSVAHAFSQADATALMPLDFSRLIWASAIGYLAFAEIPDPWTWVGGTVIFVSGLYVAYREDKVRRGENRS